MILNIHRCIQTSMNDEIYYYQYSYNLWVYNLFRNDRSMQKSYNTTQEMWCTPRLMCQYAHLYVLYKTKEEIWTKAVFT